MAGKRKVGMQDSSSSAKKSKSSGVTEGSSHGSRRSTRLLEAHDNQSNGTGSPLTISTTAPGKGRRLAKDRAVKSTKAIKRGRPRKAGSTKISSVDHSTARQRDSVSNEDEIDTSEHSVILTPITPEDHEASRRRFSKDFQAAQPSQIGLDHDLNDNEDSSTPNYWLMKAEPESRMEKGIDVKFSIDDLAKVDMEGWDGVRNAVARNNMRQMMLGDLAFFYHSNCKKPGIAGIMEIVKEHSVDETAFDSTSPYYDPKSDLAKPKWCLVHVAFRQKFPGLLSLKELQKCGEKGGVLENLQTLKQSRLSVSKVSKKEWDFIIKISGISDDVNQRSPRENPAEPTPVEHKAELSEYQADFVSPQDQAASNAVAGPGRSAKKRKKRKLTTKKQRREAREEAGYGYHEFEDPDSPHFQVRYWKSKQVDVEDDDSQGVKCFNDYYVEELRRWKAVLKEENSWNRTPKPPYRERKEIMARSAENGFPQPDPYDEDHDCFVWNRLPTMHKPIERAKDESSNDGKDSNADGESSTNGKDVNRTGKRFSATSK